MDPGVAGSVGAALWCLYRFEELARQRPALETAASRRAGGAAALRRLTAAWAAAAVVLNGSGACLAAAFSLAVLASPQLAAAIAYSAICTFALAVLLIVETLNAIYRVRLSGEARASARQAARALGRGARASRLPL